MTVIEHSHLIKIGITSRNNHLFGICITGSVVQPLRESIIRHASVTRQLLHRGSERRINASLKVNSPRKRGAESFH